MCGVGVCGVRMRWMFVSVCRRCVWKMCCVVLQDMEEGVSGICIVECDIIVAGGGGREGTAQFSKIIFASS